MIIPTGSSSAFFQAASEMFSHYQIEVPWNKNSDPEVTKMFTLEGCSSLLKETGLEVVSIGK